MINLVTVIFRDNLPQLTCLIICLTLFAITPLEAATNPKSLPADQRIGEIVYENDQVFQIHTGQGIATHIILDPAEKIISSAAGAPADCHQQGSNWCVVARVGANEVFIQPRNAAAARNNLQLTTNLRRYSFEFLNTPHATSSPWFRVTFRYPPDSAAAQQQQQPSTPPALAAQVQASRPPAAAGATREPPSSGLTITLVKALELHVPTDYTVLPHPEIDLDRTVLLNQSNEWSTALASALSSIGADMTIDVNSKIIRLTPKKSISFLSD